jgi:hypothetical protein
MYQLQVKSQDNGTLYLSSQNAVVYFDTHDICHEYGCCTVRVLLQYDTVRNYSEYIMHRFSICPGIFLVETTKPK